MKFSTIGGFLLGGIAGFFTAKYFCEKQYEAIIDQEIESIREAFSKAKPFTPMERRGPDEKDLTMQTPEKTESSQPGTVRAAISTETRIAYDKIITDNGYRPTEPKKKPEKPAPEIVDPEEYSANEEDYQQLTLLVFRDGVVTDDEYDTVTEDELNDLIGGRETLKHFGEYEDDSIFVRNVGMECYYEVLLREESYEEAIRRKPYIRRE